MIPIPDLLNREPFLGIDQKALSDLLGLAILGREIGTEFHDLMAEAETPEAAWRPEFFEQDLFVDRLIEESFELRIDGVHYPINERFLRRALTATPTDLETIEFRQGVLRELDDDEEVLASARRLYRELFGLLSLHRMPRYHSVLDTASHNLDILKQSRLVIDLMHDRFETARSGLRTTVRRRRRHPRDRGVRDPRRPSRLRKPARRTEPRHHSGRRRAHPGARGSFP